MIKEGHPNIYTSKSLSIHKYNENFYFITNILMSIYTMLDEKADDM